MAYDGYELLHIEVEGGTLIKRIDDARPGDPNSSMKIWCIDFGEFGIALIEGIDRAENAQILGLQAFDMPARRVQQGVGILLAVRGRAQ